MKHILAVMLLLAFFACNNASDKNQPLQTRIDSLEKKIANAYKPGFGEIMTGIQAHHAKLWFAGQHKNWKLADFEIHEIMEAIADIRQYETERKESQLIDMIDPAIDSVSNAIRQQNAALFNSSYTLLTNTCNNCHHAANFEFNVVKIPDSQSFSNQDFRVR